MRSFLLLCAVLAPLLTQARPPVPELTCVHAKEVFAEAKRQDSAELYFEVIAASTYDMIEDTSASLRKDAPAWCIQLRIDAAEADRDHYLALARNAKSESEARIHQKLAARRTLQLAEFREQFAKWKAGKAN